ncbi:MAG: DUF4037 domain-containing protein [Clostridiales bacterium]|nr:DUF4037 domain-containing protein [Clostridiales bacterium]
MIDSLFNELANLTQVEAIALGGSRAGEVFDDKSDYDVYLYCTGEVTKDEKQPILEKYCSYMELSNHFWELEDNCKLKNGIDIDILYRNLDDFILDVATVVEQHIAHNGYTTCMWHNLLTCKVVCDKSGRLTETKKRFDVPYPQELKRNIIDKNCKLLYAYMPAYLEQIKKAVKRKDIISINHRMSAFMESYFDVIFALNEQTHPGEKRLVALAKARCACLPEDFEENINMLYSNLFVDSEKAVEVLEDMIHKLKTIL